MSRILNVMALALLAIVLAVPAVAQRGTGDSEGIVRQGIQPPLVPLAGTVEEVVIGPCHRTTGRAAIGAHVMLATGDGVLNLHLGPAAVLDDLVERLAVGTPVTVNAFRTDALPAGAYVAQEVTVGGDTFVLRDDILRPMWAIGPGGGRGRGGGFGAGQGLGGGQGPGGGQGAGSGQGLGGGPCGW